MREKYENLLNEVEEMCRKSYTLAEILYGYCEYLDGEMTSSIIISDFFKEIRDKQLDIINLIDERTTEIGHELYKNAS